MLYVSQYDRKHNMYGVTDTEDGTTDAISKEDLLDAVHRLKLKVRGVKGNTIEVVSVTKQINEVGFGRFQDMVSKLVGSWDEEACMEVARSAHFVKKIKGLPIDEMRKVTAEYVYPKNIQDAVSQAQQYTNQVHEVNVTDRNAVIDALKNNVCLMLQHKTNGVLTSFICTGSFAVEDSIYELGFFDAVYLTRQLYSYTYNIDKVRPKSPNADAKEKNPSMLNVMSCALRFRNDGVHHDKGNMVLSNPFYTVNLDRLFGMYILDNPSQLGNTILGEFKRSEHLGTYDFDFDMYKDVLACCLDGTNYFGNHDKFMEYVDGSKGCKVSIDELIERFQSDFDYMEFLRGRGYSFNA